MRIIADIGSEIRMPGTCVVTTRREIARKPELAKQIVGTYVDAEHIFKIHPDTAKAFLHNHLEFEEGVIERIYEYYRVHLSSAPLIAAYPGRHRRRCESSSRCLRHDPSRSDRGAVP